MKHDELLCNAMRAIEAVHDDRSVDSNIRLSSMETLRDHAEGYVDIISVEIAGEIDMDDDINEDIDDDDSDLEVVYGDGEEEDDDIGDEL